MIGHVDAAAAGHQHAPHLHQRLGADDAPLLFALARPWVGEVDVDLVDRRVRKHVAQDQVRVVVDQADVRQTAFGHAVADHAVVVQRLLDADEIHIRLRRRFRDEKASLA